MYTSCNKLVLCFTSVRLLSFSKVPGLFRDCVCRAFPEQIRNFARIIHLWKTRLNFVHIVQNVGVMFHKCPIAELFKSSGFIPGLCLPRISGTNPELCTNHTSLENKVELCTHRAKRWCYVSQVSDC